MPESSLGTKATMLSMTPLPWTSALLLMMMGTSKLSSKDWLAPASGVTSKTMATTHQASGDVRGRSSELLVPSWVKSCRGHFCHHPPSQSQDAKPCKVDMEMVTIMCTMCLAWGKGSRVPDKSCNNGVTSVEPWNFDCACGSV